MLILTRRKDEEIVIGNEIVVRVLDVMGNTVRLGINAPSNISVHRREISDKILKQMIGEIG